MAVGEFYFAYADAGETFNSGVHNVKDEDIFAYRYTQTEGDFAQIEFDIRNPRVGLLNSSRQQWAFFSFYHPTLGIFPLFYGRVVGVPTNLFAEIVTVTYTARPENYVDVKAALAETLKVAPFWDPIFIAADKMDDPDAVLESRAALWHVNPVTHEMTTSSVIVGEDGTVEKQADEYFADSFSLTLNQSPASRVVVKGSVEWDQHVTAHADGLDLMPFILKSFPGHLVESFTLAGLISSWPKTDANMSGGYMVQKGELENVSFLAVPQMVPPDWVNFTEYFYAGLPAALPEGSIFFQPRVSGKFWSGEEAGFDVQIEQAFAPKGYGKGTLLLSVDTTRQYTEVINIELKTSVQPIVTEPGADEVIQLTINGNKVSDFIAGEIPIGDVRRSKFFETQRGKDAVKYLICCARAALMIKSRAVEIEFELPFVNSFGYTLRKNSMIHNPRLPGGQAVGKVIGFSHSLDGDSGAAVARIKMASCIGYGEEPYTEKQGDPTWAEAAFVGPDWQTFNNVVSLIDPAITELAFTVEAYTPQDDGIDALNLEARDIVETVEVQNPAAAQLEQLEPLMRDIRDSAEIAAVLQEYYTQVAFRLRNLDAGPFETQVNITVEDLIIPAQIDLEAPSVGP